ncbi:ABC transporter permease [Ignisphaera sp. 4213-co]|uniref:ABC transporter permease n=1 Tax=Ignisphaera cupida TaxID=3050454 RepID=A0ABD4Z7W2_9CREN|nr:ABC transporter permease [Ignisphaera sp. 4213-co]MDK6028789.1 ABC transporter permease [Ignisphaera sp. 4213-co]
MLTLNYIAKRIVISTLLIFGIVILTFLMIQLTPGDPAIIWAGKPRGPGATAAIARAREYLGLNLPLYQRLALYMYKFLMGDWGLSVEFKQPVFHLVVRNFMASLEIVVYAFAVAVPLSLWLGTRAALSRGGLGDKTIYFLSVVLAGMPRFLVAVLIFLMLYLFGYGYLGLRVSPKYTTFSGLTGMITVDSLIAGRLDIFLDAFLRLIPASIALATYPMGVITRVVRVSLSETFEEEYVRQAISIGLPRKVIVRRYAYPNIVSVVAQLTGLLFSYMLLETMVIENVFSREGLGTLTSRAIVASDYPVVIGATVFTSIVLIVANTIADIVQAVTNPRVQL